MKSIKKYLKTPFSRQKRDVPICLFCYHKVGTVLLAKVFRDICKEKSWNIEVLNGKQSHVPKDADVVLYSHSLIDPEAIDIPFRGVHLVRDPRDIIVSGYQYHRRTDEPWCTNSDFTPQQPILFPKVPYSQQHRPEKWKAGYLASLNGQSYQDNLLKIPQTEGLLFEMNHYGAWTIEAMLDWNYQYDPVLELKFEDIMGDYTNAFQKIFEHLQFTEADVAQCLDIAAAHNLQQKSASDIDKMKHVTSRKTSRWRDYFEPIHKETFQNKFGDALVNLGYESDANW